MQNPVQSRAKRSWFQRSLPFWLILPTLLVLLVVQVYPALYTLWLSLHERKAQGWVFIGARNFQRLAHLHLFQESVGHTLVFLAGFIVLTMTAGFAMALLLNRKLRFSGFYITLLFIPWVLADIIVGIAFRLLVIPDYGLLAGFLQNPALFPPKGLSVLTAAPPQPWFGDFPFPPAPAMVLLILASSWRALPFVTLLMLAAMQTIPGEIIESSRMDGANGWQMVRHILIPLMLPTLVVALFSLTLTGVNGVGMVFSLTGGGPGTATEVLSYLLYDMGWGQLRFGQAAALALMMAVVNWLLISGTLRLTRVEKEGGAYDA